MAPKPTPKAAKPAKESLEQRTERLRKELFGKLASGKELTGREDIIEVMTQCFPAFGGKHVRRAYELMRQAIAENHTIFASVAGPITASDYARVWLNPFIKAGYISTLTASDAISYHDAHDAVEGKRRIFDVDMNGDDSLHHDAGIIRITDIGFPEEVLYDTDNFMTWVLLQPEFQKRMTTTEYRWQLGKYIHALEKKRNIPHGLLATAYECDLPIFCPSPADGSTFLNAVKLWAMQNELGQKLPREFKLEIDLPKDVYEFGAYHLWSQHKEGNGKIACFVFGGGAVKNYTLQPEPFLGQIMFVETGKYDIDVQMTTAPVTDGSLSSCTPDEAKTWDKVQEGARAVSVLVDYTMVMSVIAQAILTERAMYEDKLKGEFKGDKKRLFAKFPDAQGFLREPRRLYSKRDEAIKYVNAACMEQLPKLRTTLNFKQ